MLQTIVSAALVGRTREVESLDQALRAAQNGAGRCILLEGEAGIGKSRLAAELGRRAAAQFTILQGHCSERDVSFPYAPWIDALRSFLAPKTAAEASECLGPFAPELVKLLPELSLLVPSLQPTPPLEPEAEKYRLFESLTRFTASLAVKPLLIVLEDLHWSDETSLELLHFLARRMSSLPILLIGTCRTEELPPRLTHYLVRLNRDHLVEEILLAPLARHEVEQMTRVLLQSDHPVAARWLDIVMPLTEGNPFFIEEIVKSLPPSRQVDQVPIPRSIQDAVQNRVEALPEATRRVLSFAAIIGERFDFALLQEVTVTDEPALLRMLKELRAAQLIVEESADQFAFRHALTREAVVATLMLRERKSMHQTVGEAIERAAGLQADARAAELGFHFYQAGVWQKAIEYSERAGERARALYAPREALSHFTRAYDAAQQLGEMPSISVLRGRAQSYELLGDFERARADYETALEVARGADDRASEWQSLIDLGFLWQSRDWVRAGEYFQQAFGLAQALDQPALVAKSLNRLGNWHTNRGQPRDALSFHQQALALFQSLNDRRGMAQTLDLLCFDSYVLGDMVQGAAYGEQAVSLLRELDERQALVNTLANLSLRPRFDTEVLGEVDLHHLARLSETAMEIARSCDYRKGEGDALSKAAACFCRAGEFGRGLELLGRAQRIAEEIEHRELLTTMHIVWGLEFCTGLLDSADARAHLESALAGAQELGSIALTSITTARLASACILQGDLERAQALLGTFLRADRPDAAEMTFLVRGAWAARAELDLALGNPAHALEIVDRLLASTVNLPQYGPHAVPRLSLLRGQALAALGRTAEAITEFQGAQVVTDGQGQNTMLWRLHAELGKTYRAIARREQAEREFSSARVIIEQMASTLPNEAVRDDFLKRALSEIPAAHVLTPRRAVMKEYGGLTERERQVAALIAQGKSNRDIAEALVLTVRTVEAHITHILEKLGLKSRAEIAVWAVSKGLKPPSI